MGGEYVYVLMGYPDIAEGKGYFYPEAILASGEGKTLKQYIREFPLFGSRDEYEQYSKGETLFCKLPGNQRAALEANYRHGEAETRRDAATPGEQVYLYFVGKESGEGRKYLTLKAIFASEDTAPDISEESESKIVVMRVFPSLKEYEASKNQPELSRTEAAEAAITQLSTSEAEAVRRYLRIKNPGVEAKPGA